MLGVVVEFPMHLIYLLRVLRRNGFACIQKVVMDETGRRLPNSQHDLLLVQLWLREVMELRRRLFEPRYVLLNLKVKNRKNFLDNLKQHHLWPLDILY